MAWLYIFVAGIFESAWAVGLRYSDGFTKLWPSVWTVIAMIISLYFLAQAVKTLPVGTAYAVWTGIGTILTVVYSIIFFHESRDVYRIIYLLLIITGIVGLRYSPDN